MRPDDRWLPVDGPGGLPGGAGGSDGFDEFGFDGFGPLDADLEALDVELGDAGLGARRALHGQTQPTRFFANRLRNQLLATYPAAAGMAAGVPASAAGAAAGAGAAGSAGAQRGESHATGRTNV
ncbi:MAG TPA: hypothetical protein VNL94_10290, partial [Candidatus Binatia bacterium]|nr:hypothetical protein [Candidatus Binatia bacterium]